MSIRPTFPPGHLRRRAMSSERGVVLYVALIALVVMTLTGLALVRTIDGGGKITGNLGIRQGAVNSGDAGVERARRWLLDNSAGAVLNANDSANGYYALRVDPTNWDAYFTATAVPTTFVDGVGNSITYVIHRLCTNAGDPSDLANGCVSNATYANPAGNSRAASRRSVRGGAQFYYRVTTRVVAPRRTVSFVQSIVAI